MSAELRDDDQSPDKRVLPSLRRHALVFSIGFLLSCFALSGVVSLTFATYLREYDGDGFLSFVITLGIALIISGTHLALIRGRTWGVSGIVAALLCGMAGVVPCYAYASYRGSLTAILLLSLVALWVINSQRYRELRRGLAYLREQRRTHRHR